MVCVTYHIDSVWGMLPVAVRLCVCVCERTCDSDTYLPIYNVAHYPKECDKGKEHDTVIG